MIADEIYWRKQVKLQSWQQSVNIPPRFQKATLSNFNVDKHNKDGFSQLVNTIRNYSGEWIYICGPTGTGKTHLAWGIAKELANKGYWPRFLKWTEVVRDMLNVLKGDGYSMLAEDFRSERPLIVDDFGSTEVGGYLADGVRDKTLELIDYRYDYEYPLIVTTNLTPAKIEEKYSSRVVSRLMGGVRLVIAGEDRRQP